MAGLARDFQLMKEFQKLRERSQQFLLQYHERWENNPVLNPELSLEEVCLAVKQTSQACFDLLARQENEWQLRIRELEDGWEAKSDEQARQWTDFQANKERLRLQLTAMHEQAVATSKARIEQLEEILRERGHLAADSAGAQEKSTE